MITIVLKTNCTGNDIIFQYIDSRSTIHDEVTCADNTQSQHNENNANPINPFKNAI